MWELVWIAAPTTLLMLNIPETHEPTIRAHQASRTSQNPSQCGKQQSENPRASVRLIVNALRDAVIRPVQIAILDPAVTVANLYTAFMYGTYYTFFDAIPTVYPVHYGFTTGQLGLTFLCIFVACKIVECDPRRPLGVYRLRPSPTFECGCNNP